MTMFRRYMDVKMIFDPRQYMILEKNSKLIKFCYTFSHLRRRLVRKGMWELFPFSKCRRIWSLYRITNDSHEDPSGCILYCDVLGCIMNKMSVLRYVIKIYRNCFIVWADTTSVSSFEVSHFESLTTNGLSPSTCTRKCILKGSTSRNAFSHLQGDRVDCNPSIWLQFCSMIPDPPLTSCPKY
jgi:hypothetical protein